MKTTLFKIVLPTFTLILGITTSLAFIAAKNAIDEDTVNTKGYYHGSDGFNCISVSLVDCDDTVFNPVCTATISGMTHQIYGRDKLQCNIVLFKRP
ncbi:DUF6520 family protein [Flavivirga abyssicola]|uniref:DUF6520 family protein n=1 Tax=Flavivirga abyssicola TaxID=3063533 RepID=UPI0026DFB103|nr:DUF6520 family protein [Flavivirga sp. MEBiC07777]WVK14136.1 DUF6520 family protein [Flavivirga sp. MEBiC07777]